MAATDDPTSHANPLWGIKGSWDPVTQVVLPPEQQIHSASPNVVLDAVKSAPAGAATDMHFDVKAFVSPLPATSFTTHDVKSEWHDDGHGDIIHGSVADGWLIV